MTNQSILHNVRILDFTWVLAGPYATRLLADFGAEVIKVQPLLPAETDDAFSRAYYATWNRNKLGITLDLNRPEGIALVKKLIKHCDAVVENFTPRVMANWGLDYENMRKIRPDIIMLSMSVMGRTGPWKDYTGFGPTVHAFSGLTGLTALETGLPLGPGFSYADHVAGLYGSMALLGALEYRRRTGEGQLIDISQVEAMAGLLGDAVLEYSMTGSTPQAEGNGSREAAPHGVYPCRDRRGCALAVFTDDEWRRFKAVAGNPAWAEDVTFTTLVGRLENREALDNYVSGWTRTLYAVDVMNRLQENGIPAGVVQDAADLARDPQLLAAGFFTQGGEYGLADASPIRLSETPAEYHRPAPPPGRDNDYVYHGLLGLSESEITGLREKKVI